MAIDTKEKRASIAGLVLPFMLGVTPNAAQDQEWRQESAWSYSGILAGGAVEVAVGAGEPTRKRRYILPDGKVIHDERQALNELYQQIEAKAEKAKAEKPKSKSKGRKSRSIHPKPPPKVAALPVLLQQQRATIEPRLFELAERDLQSDGYDEEEAIISVILLAV